MHVNGTLLKGINIACVASASVWFRNNERPRRNGISGFGRAKNGTRVSPPFYSRHFSRQRFSTLVPRFLLRNRTETFTTQANWELKQPRRRPQRRLQKTIALMIKTTALHVTFFSTFLWRPLHDYDVKPPNLTLYGGRGHTTTNFPSSFWAWIKSLRIQLREKSPTFDILSGSK